MDLLTQLWATGDTRKVAEGVLAADWIWGEHGNLNTIPGLTDMVEAPIKTIVFDLIQHPNTRLQALRSQTLDADDLTTEQWVNNTDTPEFQEDGFLQIGRAHV